ncbi:MAG: YidC/Oxa1 family membrane protein insertase [Tissierellia bacterium]|nr:YidC/Oxa1 family membrane protein insertase [Tissierellia bacterium]
MTLSPAVMGFFAVLAKEVTPEKKNFLANIFGIILRKIYDFMSSAIPVEPELFSYLAMSIIIVTIFFKLILLPLSIKQSKSTKMMSEINPKIKELQVKYKNDPNTLADKQRKLYKEMGYNPMSGCLLLLLQLPIIIALFSVLREPQLYAFSDPGMYDSMNKAMLWIPNLDLKDPVIFGLPLMAAVATFLQSKITQQGQVVTDAQQQSMTNTMMYMGPVMIFFFAMRYPAGLALYWTVSSFFSVFQQIIINHSKVGEKEKA